MHLELGENNTTNLIPPSHPGRCCQVLPRQSSIQPYFNLSLFWPTNNQKQYYQ